VGGVADDGDGTILLGYHADDSFGPGVRKHVFFQIKDGAGVRVGGTVIGAADAFHFVFSQPSGFTAFSVGSDFGSSFLESWSHDGVFQSRTTVVPFDAQVSGPHPPSSVVGVDPSGGTVAVKTVFSGDKFVTTYRRFDKTGAPETGEVPVDNGGRHVAAVGVALSGHALILSTVSAGNFEARWVARDGTAISNTFMVQYPTAVPAFQFLVDGSLALGFVGGDEPPSRFVSRIEDGAEATGPLPAWLFQRASNALSVVRQGRAYAMWGGAGGECGQDLEVLSTTGKSCGCVKVPGLSISSTVGRDSSLIVPHQNVPACSYDLYPKLLR